MARFSITPWPGVQMTLPEHLWSIEGKWRVTAGEAIVHAGSGSRSGERAPAPGHPVTFGEVYLTLEQLDLGDIAAIDDWIQRYGPMGLQWAQHAVNADHVYVDGTAPFRDERVGWRDPQWDFLRLSRDVAIAELQALNPHRDVDPSEVYETVEEFRFAARLIRDLARYWRALQRHQQDVGEEDLPALLIETPMLHRDPTVFPGAEAATVAATATDPEKARAGEWAASMLEAYLEPLLRPFYPRLRAADLNASRASEPFQQNISLYHFLALELFNHIVEGEPYKTCANEPCGLLFVRQSGRAEHGQFRMTGVRYCSASCARAQAQREYRRRKRKTKTAPAA